MSIVLRAVHSTAASALTLAVLLTLGCSHSGPPAATAAATPAAAATTAPLVVAAKDPFWAMYKSAHDWAPDVVAIRLTQMDLQGYKNQAGKAGMWEAAFASPSLRQYRLYTFAVADVPPNVFKGVTAGMPMPWAGETRDAMAVDLTSFNVDSDAAFQTGSGEAAAWLKANPGKELSALELGQTYKFSGPVWYIQWGSRTGGYSALVDATTGKVLNHK
ncbi:MAG TPA: hypothetical protein VHX13_00875 [Acidobacteriaceae bacterium]|jgi:hypothetical protein|nr:hypothetical protein [Acidobacteriaceae bacterium]